MSAKWALVASLLVLLSCHWDESEGYCMDSGLVHQDDTSWRLSPCLVCTCNASAVLCEELTCPGLICDVDKRETPTFQPTECCPTCRQRLRSCRRPDGSSIAHGAKWHQRACEECVCADGMARCRALRCSELDCNRSVSGDTDYATSSSSITRGAGEFGDHAKCCDACRQRSLCYTGRRYYSVGDVWQPVQCVRCACNEGGQTQCFAKECAPLSSCKGKPFVPEGSCCPVCPDTACSHNGNSYQNGQQWQAGCSDCICIAGRSECVERKCTVPEEDCEQGFKLVASNDGCCHHCIPVEAVCEYEGSVYYEGQQWNVSRCGFCTCAAGKVVCQTAQCTAITQLHAGTCPPGERLFEDDDSCCPQCRTLRFCATSRGNLKDGDSWREGPCKSCVCSGSVVDCYVSSCYSSEYYSGDISPGTMVSVVLGGRILIASDKFLTASRDKSSGSALVVKGPLYGRLVTKTGTQLSLGSWANLSLEGLAYEHSGGSMISDYLLLHVFSGRTSASHLVQVQVTEPLPRVSASGKLVMSALSGGMAIVNSTALSYFAEGHERHSLVYDITKPSSLGDMVVVVPVPLSGVLPGWTADGVGTEGYNIMWLQTSTFRQADVDDGRIYYQHRGADIGKLQLDNLTFSVSCELHNMRRETVEDQRLSIFVSPRPRSVHQATARPSSAAPAPVMMALENQTTVILPEYLPRLSHDEQSDDGVLYTITRPLASEHGIVEYADAPFFSIRRFTQQDIIDRRVVYRPPLKDQGPMAKDFNFGFTVSDLSSGVVSQASLAEQRLGIRIVPVNNQPPRLRVGHSPLELTVPRAGSAALTRQLLDIDDADSLPEHLSVTLKSLPLHGDLVKSQGGLRIYLRLDDRFTYSEILNNSVRYIHDGSSAAEDSINLKVDDGDHSLDANVKITVLTPLDGIANIPTKSPLACMATTVKEAESVILTPAIVDFASSVGDATVQFTLASAPQLGQLKHTSQGSLTVGKTFTQQEVNAGLLSYAAGDEVGYADVADSIYLNVSNSAGGTLPFQALVITIYACDNQPPYCVQHAIFKVEEGGHAQLTGTHLKCDDVDTPLEQLVVMVEVEPSFGILQTITSVTSTDEVKRVHVKAFALGDLNRGQLYYIQSNHSYMEPRSDVFSFHVTDGTNASPTSIFNITIEAANDEPPNIVADHVFVEEGSKAVITTSSVYVTDIDTDTANMVLTLGTPCSFGSLTRSLTSSGETDMLQHLGQGDTFLYWEIQQGRITYIHDGGEASTNDSFILSVSDGRFTDSQLISVAIALIDDETPRLVINNGITIKRGMTSLITKDVLRATDIDSEDAELVFVITKPPSLGVLRQNSLNAQGPISISATQRVTAVSRAGSTGVGSSRTTSASALEGIRDLKLASRFTQLQIDLGYIEYAHSDDGSGIVDFFKFNVVDMNNNTLLEQTFYIDITTDTSLPEILRNNKLIVVEKGTAKLTTNHLLTVDSDVDADGLIYEILEQPRLGHLEAVEQRGIPITEFTQAKLSAGKVIYVHTSLDETAHSDSVIFSVTDGSNSVTQSFYIEVLPVDDSLPLVTASPLIVREGDRRVVTEFELIAVDNDTRDDRVTFTIVRQPTRGQLELRRGAASAPVTKKLLLGSTFSMADVYAGSVSYAHDGSESLQDVFQLTVFDGTNSQYVVGNASGLQELPTSVPLEVKVNVIPVDNGVPYLVLNNGIHYLESHLGKVVGIISEFQLKVEDNDTTPDKLVFKITRAPAYGQLEKTNALADNTAVSQFTQADINSGAISYVLTTDPGRGITSDSFEFDLMDSQPNTLKGNKFHILWTVCHWGMDSMRIKETDRVAWIPIICEGNLKQYRVVSCRPRPGNATATANKRQQEQPDYDDKVLQVQFDSWQSLKTCDISIRDDSVYEGPESFFVELEAPVHALLTAPTRIEMIIDDTEDQPVMQFPLAQLEVNETDGYAKIHITRSGDDSPAVTVTCVTYALTATGSKGRHYTTGTDYESRPESRRSTVYLAEGIRNATCDVRIIDDALYEETEEFEVRLSQPSYNARLGTTTSAAVKIIGPNDQSTVSMATSNITITEGSGQVPVHVVRQGVDLSMVSSVWCMTKLSNPPTAEPLEDYDPLAVKVTFQPQQTSAMCTVKILDDAEQPRVEGAESFVVTLGAVTGGAVVGEMAETQILIDDALQDAPQMQFQSASYRADENRRIVTAAIIRVGDLSQQSSAICYTRQRTAMAGEDFEERPLLNSSRITFSPGQNLQNCTVYISDDDRFENDETFVMRLTQPLPSAPYAALLGEKDTTTVTITDLEDEPTLMFERPAYSVAEPSRVTPEDESASATSHVLVRILRTGDTRASATVRCSTRDGSATSAVDYRANSQVLTFEPGMSYADVDLAVLRNAQAKWHLSFSLVLETPTGARLGGTTSTVVTILDNKEMTVIVMPAAPMVISLENYREGQQRAYMDSPSAGFPLLCLTSCDPCHPAYIATAPACQEGTINGSATRYQWEVAAPGISARGSQAPATFMTLTDATPFGGISHQVLESFYYRAGFRVRCTVQPVGRSGLLGVPLRSQPVEISAARPVCGSHVTVGNWGDSAFSSAGFSYAFSAQSFVATLNYLTASDSAHPNTVHIRITMPHQDGMLPLISSLPLSDVRLLMTSVLYRQQHLCSNFYYPDGSLPGQATGETQQGKRKDELPSIRDVAAMRFYRNLDTKKCQWTFDAWYTVSQLVEVCGGSAVNAFDQAVTGAGYLTVRLPVYVAYLFAAGPAGWTSLEQQTEASLSFHYETSQLHAGMQVGIVDSAEPNEGQLHLTKLTVDTDGRLVVEFRTVAKHRGLYVTQHSTLPGTTSRVLPPPGLLTEFDLRLLTTQPTYDGPSQMWRATSKYSLQDYSGMYEIELVPCAVKATQRYTPPVNGKTSCSARQPVRFPVSISFQQTLRPVPARYTLNAYFQLTSDLAQFLSDPRAAFRDGENDIDDLRVFVKGRFLYGRVYWDPSKDLGSAYGLTIKKVFVCAGADGYVPSYDPTGDIYGKGQQYGCLQPSTKLRYRYLVLDDTDYWHSGSEASDKVDFEAVFARDSPELSVLQGSYHGANGFRMSIDPLYEVAAQSYRWYVQVLYTIGPSGEQTTGRRRRAARSTSATSGTGMVAIALVMPVAHGQTAAPQSPFATDVRPSRGVVAAMAVVMAAVAAMCITVLVLIKRRQSSGQLAPSSGAASSELVKQCDPATLTVPPFDR